MAWSELEPKVDIQAHENLKAEHDALMSAAVRALDGSNQAPLKAYLEARANSISFRPGIPAEEVAFREGQRSLALQLLKLAGEIQ